MILAKVVCPKCEGTHCRHSKWHSAREKLDHAGQRPYRCLDCSNRFLTAGGERFRRLLILGASTVLALTIIAPLAAAWFWSEQSLETKQSIESSAPTDPETQSLAEEGDPNAQYRLAKTLLHDSVRDPASTIGAIQWLKAAAEQEHTGAMVQLGKMYRSGVGVLQDFSEAARWINKAALLGSAEGMLELGRLYRDGVGFERDFVQAYVWFNRSAAALNIEAAQEREYIARKLNPEDLLAAQSASTLTAEVKEAAAAKASTQ
jgi:TPR repeat protein